jgi:hypothetical protein
MRPPRLKFTICWLMVRIAVFGAAFAFLVAADRDGRSNGCDAPLLYGMALLVAFAATYMFIQMAVFGMRHPS